MKPLAVLIAMYCSGAVAAGANDAAPNAAATSDGSPEQIALQEIVVTGLRESLITSETI